MCHPASIDGSQGSGEGSGNGRGSPLTSQRVLDIIESSYPNPISVKEICSTTQTDESIVRLFVDELASKEKINSTDDGQNYTRTTKLIDTKINLVKQMPPVFKSQPPVIAILTSQYCEKLAVDSMISDKETFVRYRTTASSSSASTTTGSSSPQPDSANYVYTLGNIGDHRVVSTKLPSIGHSRGALIAAGSATTRLLGTFPELEYVFLVGCGGGVVNYTDFASHVRLGDVVVSHLPSTNLDDLGSALQSSGGAHLNGTSFSAASANSASDHVYVHCRPKQQQDSTPRATKQASLPVSYSIHKNLKRALTNGEFKPISRLSGDQDENQQQQQQHDGELNSSSASATQASGTAGKPLEYEECHFRLWRPARLDLQELTVKLWLQGLDNPKHRIWEYYIDEGIKTLKQQDVEATRPAADTDKLFMSIGSKDTIEVSHPEAGEGEVDLRSNGRPMCHFGPVGSGRPANSSETLRQRMISEFGLRAFDSEFDPVVESIYGNRKECYIMIRGISDYKDGRKRKEWQQYSALVAAAFMKSIIVNLKPLA